MDNHIDQASPVREGESLDVDRLARYLESALPGLDPPIEILQFPKGYSNLTYLVRARGRELVLRRPPLGATIKSAHDMAREHRILSRLAPVYPRVPKPLAYCEDETVIGAPFYVMERVSGVILRAAPPPGVELAAPLMRRVSEALIDNLAEIHAVDYRACGLGDLGRPDGYLRRQVDGWTDRYARARTEEIPDLEGAAAWLAARQPAASGAALIHNDYKYDNLVFAPRDLARIVAVLDWEMATIGDPLMDLGTTLGYWVGPDDPEEWQRHEFGVTTLAGNLSRTELVERYARASGRDTGDIVFYYVYALFKIAVIVQQIYARYAQGLTRDARFGGLIHVVRSCGAMTSRAIERGRIDSLG